MGIKPETCRKLCHDIRCRRTRGVGAHGDDLIARAQEDAEHRVDVLVL